MKTPTNGLILPYIGYSLTLVSKTKAKLKKDNKLTNLDVIYTRDQKFERLTPRDSSKPTPVNNVLSDIEGNYIDTATYFDHLYRCAEVEQYLKSTEGSTAPIVGVNRILVSTDENKDFQWLAFPGNEVITPENLPTLVAPLAETAVSIYVYEQKANGALDAAVMYYDMNEPQQTPQQAPIKLPKKKSIQVNEPPKGNYTRIILPTEVEYVKKKRSGLFNRKPKNRYEDEYTLYAPTKEKLGEIAFNNFYATTELTTQSGVNSLLAEMELKANYLGVTLNQYFVHLIDFSETKASYKDISQNWTGTNILSYAVHYKEPKEGKHRIYRSTHLLTDEEINEQSERFLVDVCSNEDKDNVLMVIIYVYNEKTKSTTSVMYKVQ